MDSNPDAAQAACFFLHPYVHRHHNSPAFPSLYAHSGVSLSTYVSMRRLLSIFFAFSLLMSTAVSGAVSLPASCPQKACCCGGEEPCCPPPAAPQTSCGRDQAPLPTAQLPQAPDEIEATITAGDPYAHPWPAALEQAMALIIEARESRFTMAVDGALERAPDRLSKLRILRI